MGMGARYAQPRRAAGGVGGAAEDTLPVVVLHLVVLLPVGIPPPVVVLLPEVELLPIVVLLLIVVTAYSSRITA